MERAILIGIVMLTTFEGIVAIILTKWLYRIERRIQALQLMERLL